MRQSWKLLLSGNSGNVVVFNVRQRDAQYGNFYRQLIDRNHAVGIAGLLKRSWLIDTWTDWLPVCLSTSQSTEINGCAKRRQYLSHIRCCQSDVTRRQTRSRLVGLCTQCSECSWTPIKIRYLVVTGSSTPGLIHGIKSSKLVTIICNDVQTQSRYHWMSLNQHDQLPTTDIVYRKRFIFCTCITDLIQRY